MLLVMRINSRNLSKRWKKVSDFFRGAGETYDRMKLERIEEKKLNIERGNHPGYVLPNPTSQKIYRAPARFRCAVL